MSDGLFSIFGDRFTTQALQNVMQPLANNGNVLTDIQIFLQAYYYVLTRYLIFNFVFFP